MNDSSFDPQTIGEWMHAAKDGLSILNTAMKLLPKGKERDDLQAKAMEASAALDRSNALLAKGFGYHLCQCKLPPSVMLWRQSIESYVCDNPECGRKIHTPRKLPPVETSYF